MPIIVKKFVTVKHGDGNLRFEDGKVFPAKKDEDGSIKTVDVQEVLYAVKDGEEILHSFVQADILGVHQETTVVCDGPRCAIFHTSHDPKTISWDEQKAQQDPGEVPNDAYRILLLTEFDGTKHIFCCKRCLADFMLEYVAPRSPRELTEEALANATVIRNSSRLHVVPPQQVEAAMEGDAQ